MRSSFLGTGEMSAGNAADEGHIRFGGQNPITVPQTGVSRMGMPRRMMQSVPLAGIMHDGGVVPKDGAYVLAKGEKVVAAKNKDKSKAPSVDDLLGKKKETGEKKSPSRKKGDKKPKVKHRSTHIDHHSDGSHTVKHQPMEDGSPEVSYAKPDHESLLAALKEQLAGGEGSESSEEAASERMPVKPMV